MEILNFDIFVLLPDGCSGSILPHFLYQCPASRDNAEKYIAEEIRIMEGRWGKGSVIAREHLES